MIRHIVLIRFRPEIPEAVIETIFTSLAALGPQITGMLDFAGGRSESPEQMERGYMHGFTIDFADWASLATYADHPDHRRAAAQLVDNAQDGANGILVFDLAIATPD